MRLGRLKAGPAAKRCRSARDIRASPASSCGKWWSVQESGVWMVRLGRRRKKSLRMVIKWVNSSWWSKNKCGRERFSTWFLNQRMLKIQSQLIRFACWKWLSGELQDCNGGLGHRFKLEEVEAEAELWRFVAFAALVQHSATWRQTRIF